MNPILDGLLNDWTASERLETPATAISGYELYGRFSEDVFYFALKAPVAIGANTTFWLNTDKSIATGYQVWGFAAGAEFNVNFGADGVPRLYTGADGQTLVGSLAYALSADGMTLELALPRTLLGAGVETVDIHADINNSVFLPADFTQPGYRIAEPVAAPPGPFDGLLTEWTQNQRLDTEANAVSGYEIYGKVDAASFVFALKSAVVIGPNSTFWLNTDGQANTGYQIWGWAGGAEYNVNVGPDGVARLYSGADGQTLVGNIDYAIAPNGLSIEFAVPKSLIGAAVTTVTMLADINNSVFLPPSYAANPGYGLVDPGSLPGSSFDGLLSEWTAAQRLDGAGNGLGGYEVYGTATSESFVFALKSAVAIGPNTTFWLNTDANAGTGYQIWGWAGGAEFNVNIGSDGIARLYTGGAGETLVGTIDFAISPDKLSIEFGVLKSQLGAGVTTVTMLADINDSVYLPASYGTQAGFTVNTVSTPPSAFDGILSEWTASDRLETPLSATAGYELYGKFDAGNFVFALKSAVTIGPNTTFWFNTDGNVSTGYQIFGSAGGAEYNVNIGADGVAKLYTGAAGGTLVGTIDYKIGPDGKTMEFAVPAATLGGVTKVGVLADVNEAVYLPGDYAKPQFTVQDPSTLLQPTYNGNKIAIVYSATSAAAYFSEMAYSQLIMAAQSQAMAAGIPFDLISEADLTDLGKLINYDAIIFPSFRNVPANYLEIQSVLTQVAYDYGTSFVTAGDFMTNDAAGASLPGNAYERMELLLGVKRTGGESGVTIQVVAAAEGNSITEGYGAGGTIRTYTGSSTSYFDASNAAFGNVTTIASQVVNNVSYNAVLGSVTGGRNVAFATEALLADSNLLGKAIDWVTGTAAGGPRVSLLMSRQTEIVASRIDMDQSQETFDVDGGIYQKLLPILDQWKAQYGFVGSYYLNIGINPPDQDTNWTISGPYYQQLLTMGSEIGSHSYTHANDTNTLLPKVVTQAMLDATPSLGGMDVATFNATLQSALAAPDPTVLSPTEKAVLSATFEFQFGVSRDALAANLGINITGAAVSGMPENIATARAIMQYVADYLSGGASMAGAGYPGAMGYLSPNEQGAVYIAPNMSFDFTLTDWLGLSPADAILKWAAELKSLTVNSDLPIVVWPWHDYGPTEWNLGNGPSKTTIEMFTSVIAAAYSAGAEFVTLKDLSQRIKAFEQTDFGYSVSGDVITVRALPATGGLGTFALDLDALGGKTVASVAGWYAYDADSVFLDSDGGTYQITLGAAQQDVTRIISIGQRAQLQSLTGDGNSLAFTIIGEGRVVIDVKQTGGLVYVVTGATVVSEVGDILTLDLGAIGTHAVSVQQIAAVNNAATDIGVSNLIILGEGTAARTKVADLTIVDPDVYPALRNNVVSVDDPRFEIDATDGGLYLKAGQVIDFETAGSITLRLSAVDGALSYSEDLVVTVGNANEAATDIVVTNQQSLVENTTARTKIADLSVVDPDLDAAMRNNVVTVSDARFEIDPTDGGLYLKAGQAIDFEAGATIALSLIATDGALSFSKPLSISVVNANDAPTGGVVVTGNVAVGQTLSANTATLADADGLGTLSYQWQRNVGGTFVAISGAIAASYVLAAEDLASSVRVVVSYVDGGGTVELVTSAATAAVGLAPATEDMLRIITAAELAGATPGPYSISDLVASSGTLSTNPDGTWTFVPVLNDDTAVTFTYKVTSGIGTIDATAVLDLAGMTDVNGTAAADTLAGRTAADQYHGGAGNDTISGGGGDDIFFGDGDTDRVTGGDGNDRIIATIGDGNDTYIGSAGTDTYDLSRTSAAAIVNLGTGQASSSETGSDSLSTIENVIGSAGDDTITGSSSANRLEGGFGDDTLIGGGGIDVLLGGWGSDRLTGGAGQDFLTGGAGADTFVFTTLSESGRTATTRDIITDFAAGEDRIDLAGIDANTSLTGNQAFTFLATAGAAFTGVRGQLQWSQVDAAGTASDRTFVAGDTNGDRVADFQIELYGLISLTQSDFIL